jgi:aromatic ring-opening dioxygenase LigB subunit
MKTRNRIPVIDRCADLSGALFVTFLAGLLLQTVGAEVEDRGAAVGKQDRSFIKDPRNEKLKPPARSEFNVNQKQKGLVFGAIMPHGPDIILEVTKDPALMAETRRAMEEAARRFAAAHVETLVLLDPEIIHTQQGEALANSCSFFKGDSVLSIGMAAHAGGRLGISEERFECDTKLAQAIFDAGRNAQFPVVADAGDKDKGELQLQGGSLIPLWYSIRPLPVPRPRIVVISPSTMVPREKLISFGELIANIAKDSGKRVAIIASADQGHRHDKNHPRFGFSLFAAQHDTLYCEAVKSNHLEKLLDISNEVLEGSFTDSLWQTLILAGGLKAVPMELTFFNYARPSYYGMVVATFEPHSAGKVPESSKP